MPSKLDDLSLKIEAVLFAAGRPMSVHELKEALAADDHRAVQAGLRALADAYGHRQSALEVRRVGDRYALQLKEAWIPTVHAVTPIEMAPRTLRVLTLVAYHQPILQSTLVRMIGESAYEEVQRLRGLNLIRTEPKGSTLELTTTRRFAEYFGLESSQPAEIRRILEGKLGVSPSPAAGPAEPPPAPAPPDPAPPATDRPAPPEPAPPDAAPPSAA